MFVLELSFLFSEEVSMKDAAMLHVATTVKLVHLIV